MDEVSWLNKQIVRLRAIPTVLRVSEDRALLLVGFTGALRRAELAAIQGEY